MNRKSSVFWIFLAILLSGPCFAATIYVDADTTGDDDGTSWANAYRYLQDALAVTSSGDEIRVAQGTYKPDQGGGVTPGDREATFQLISGVAIKGGYAGFGEPDPDVRNVDVYETILSGDLNGDDVGATNNGENSYHVVTGSGTEATAVLDGFTTAAGNANSLNPYNNGAGMYNDNGNPAVANCTFSGNHARRGGAMFNDNSSPTLTDCTFSGNWASYFGAGMFNNNSSPTLTNCMFSGNTVAGGGGGGMYNYWNSTPTVTDCTFSGNWAGWGGGMYNEDCSPTLTNCTFSGNWAAYGGGMENDCSSPMLTNCTFSGNSAGNIGGGMLNALSSPTVTNCTFSGNMAESDGGGMHNHNTSNPTVTNCTFSGNSATNGNALAFDSPNQSSPSTIQMGNCILWDGGSEIWNNDGSTIAITYSDVEGGWTGEGNINADPLFVDAANGDYHLLPDSPCVDVGDNTALPPDTLDLDGDGDIDEPIPFDLDGNPRIVNDIVDMGAYEFLAVIPVAIDIKPGSYPNAINLGSHGLIPVAILSSEQFDATTVDADTVELAGSDIAVRGKGNKFLAHAEDVNGDSLVDLVVQVATANLEPESLQDGLATLSAKTYDGQDIEGSDEVIIVPPEQ